MWKRIAAIAFIFLCTAAAWMILGSTIFMRTYQRAPGLREKVVSNWGGPHTQRPPWICDSGQSRPPDASRINASLHLDYRQKGLLWYSTYAVRFASEYTFRNDTDDEHAADIRFALPSTQAIYDDLSVTLDGNPVEFLNENNQIAIPASIPARRSAVIGVSYRSQGLDEWRYEFGKTVSQIRDFNMKIDTDFAGADFADGTLSPASKQRSGSGWEYEWKYRNLMTGQMIGLSMPERLQPGPLAGEISYFAPVSLLFFFFVLYLLTFLDGIDLHPVNYFFLAAAFFAFHLLFAYLVDHIEVRLSFFIASLVSVFLVVSYLRLVAGLRFAGLKAGAAQFVYLILFSYAFFFRGYTGLAITVGAILTLFVAMQVTGRMRWTPSDVPVVT